MFPYHTIAIGSSRRLVRSSAVSPRYYSSLAAKKLHAALLSAAIPALPHHTESREWGVVHSDLYFRTGERGYSHGEKNA